MAKKDKVAFFVNKEKAVALLDKIAKLIEDTTDAQQLLILAPDCILGINGKEKIYKNLWGYTEQKYGEELANALHAIDPKTKEGLIFHMLRQDESLSKKVLCALLRQYIENAPIKDQKLYSRVKESAY